MARASLFLVSAGSSFVTGTGLLLMEAYQSSDRCRSCVQEILAPRFIQERGAEILGVPQEAGWSAGSACARAR